MKFTIRLEGYRARYEVLEAIGREGLKQHVAFDDLIDQIPGARSDATDQSFIVVEASRRDDVVRCLRGQGPEAQIIAEQP